MYVRVALTHAPEISSYFLSVSYLLFRAPSGGNTKCARALAATGGAAPAALVRIWVTVPTAVQRDRVGLPGVCYSPSAVVKGVKGVVSECRHISLERA